jgi:hypothetical protein
VTDRDQSYRYLDRLRLGQEIVVDGHRYGRCADCRKIVRTDKFLIGDLHLCSKE